MYFTLQTDNDYQYYITPLKLNVNVNLSGFLFYDAHAGIKNVQKRKRNDCGKIDIIDYL